MLVVKPCHLYILTATHYLLFGTSMKQPERVHTLGCKLFQRSALGPKSHLVNIRSFSVEVCTGWPARHWQEGCVMREVDNSDETVRIVCWIYKTGLAISKSVAHK